MRSPFGRSLFASEAYGRARTMRRRAAVAVSRRRSPELTAGVAKCFFFIGHTKSGGSLLGSLLDAHPDVICSDELGLVQLLVSERDPDGAFRLAARNAAREARKGRVTARRVDPYSLAVPGQSQGRMAAPMAVGDSRAGPTTRFLAANPEALDVVGQVLSPVALQAVHVVRNPFDPIAVMVVRGGRTIEGATQDYRDQCERVSGITPWFGRDRLRVVRYEEFVADPRAALRGLCGWLGVAPSASYLDACAAVVDSHPRLDRHRITWDGSAIRRVERIIADYPFLAGYSFEGAA